MITLITGVPGSGKTLYSVGVLVQDFLKATFTHLDEVKPRTIYTNIKNLLSDHVLINADNLNNWQDWVKPGDVIVYDEVQEVWRPRSMGLKVPMHIEKLETHRHMGVDFVLISQHPMLLDQNIRRLVGKHIHVRRIGSFALAMLYEWDHASNPSTTSTCLSKTPFKFDKKFYKFYKSAEAHTKQKFKTPVFILITLAVMIVAAVTSPYTYERFKKRFSSTEQTTVTTSKGDTLGLLPKDDKTTKPTIPNVPQEIPVYKPVYPLTDLKSVPTQFKPMGCVASKKRCECFGPAGEKIEVSKDQCIKASTQIAYITNDVKPQTVFSNVAKSEQSPVQKSDNLATQDTGFNLPLKPAYDKYQTGYAMPPSGNLQYKNIDAGAVVFSGK